MIVVDVAVTYAVSASNIMGAEPLSCRVHGIAHFQGCYATFTVGWVIVVVVLFSVGAAADSAACFFFALV